VSELKEEIQRGLVAFFEERIPFNRHLGMKVVSVSPGRCEMSIPIQPHLIGDLSRPALHGGVIAALADTVGGLALLTRNEDAGFPKVSTIDLRIDYLQPATTGHPLMAVSEVVRFGNRVGVTDTVVRQGDRVVAQARGVYNIVWSD